MALTRPDSPLRWLFVVPASIGLGWLFDRWNVPAGWILAAIVVSGTVALGTGHDLQVNKYYRRFGRGIIGILAAMPIVGVSLGEIAGTLIPAAVFGAVTVGAGVGGGILLGRSEKEISTETAILSMLPGGASTMPALADEIGADYRYVALVQYLRLLIVSVTLPAVAHLLTPPAEGGHAIGADFHFNLLAAVLIVAAAMLGDPIGQKLKIPAAGVLCPMLLAVIGSWVTPDSISFEPPMVFAVMAFLSIGWIAGGALSVPTLKLFARQLPVTVAYIFFMMAVCAGAGVLAALWTGVTHFEGYLATTPGALETVLALSAEGGAGSEVITFQILRLVAVLLLAAWLPQILRIMRR